MSTRRKNRIRVLVLACVAAAVAAAGTGAVQYTSRTNFCGSCHEMKASHAGWSGGAHGKTHCYDCHVENSISGHVAAKANGLRQVFVHFSGPVDMEKVTAEVPSHRCVRCHNMQDEEKFGTRIVTAHRKHIEAKIECLTCHVTSGHSREAFAGFRQDSCKECHSNKPQEVPNPYLKRPPCTRPAEMVVSAGL